MKAPATAKKGARNKMAADKDAERNILFDLPTTPALTPVHI